ncbi:MAG: AAA family ATPase [Actinobacteria bacterium]|nr:AAA family ATPase [Actinomycetota bacterium]
MTDHAPRLVGREAEMAALQRMLERAEAGGLQVGIVEGEAGIGKSRLFDELLQTARTKAFQVYRGAADELEKERPFRALADALGLDPRAVDSDRADVGRLLYGALAAPGGSEFAEAPDMSFRITESIVALLETAATKSPVVLALEDVHWSEVSTVRAVRALARRLGHLPLVLLLSMRPLPRSPELDRAIEGFLSGGALMLRIDPLDSDAVALLAADLTSAVPGGHLLEQVTGAGGNPLFVIELVRALQDEGAITIDDGKANVAEALMPPSLRITILRRMSVLPQETLDILGLASILGSSFSLTELSLVATKSIVQLYAALQDAIRAGFIGESGDRLAFRHDLIREAIYEDMPLAVRKAFHREVGQALARAGVPAGRVAEHMYLGAIPGDAEAITWLRRAAREASSRSLVVARNWMERALELAGPDDPERERIVAELVPSLAIMGRAQDVEALANDVLAATKDPAVALALRRGLAHGFVQRGAFASAAEQTDMAASYDGIADRDRAELLALGSMFKMFSGDPDQAAAQAESAIAKARSANDEYAEFLALHTLALVAAARGHIAEAVDQADQIRTLESRVATPWSGYLVSNLYRGAVLLDADRLEESDAAYQAGRRLCEERGGTPFLPAYQWSLARGKYLRGLFDDALAEIETGIALADEIGQRWQILPYGLLARIAIHRGDLARTESALADAERALMEAGPQVGFDWMMWCRALLLEAQGDVPAAAAVLGNAWNAFAPLRYLVAYRSIAPDLVRFALAAGDSHLAARVTADVEEGARRSKLPTAQGAALRCRGLVENDVDLLVDAVASYRDGPRPIERALACEEAGVALGRSGRGEEAAGLLSEALVVYEEVQATRDVARATSVLREFGVRRPRRSKRTRATVGWEALTATEREVARLAAQGLTNRQIGARLFISPRTVETHLSHAFQKLSLSTRVELAAEVARLGA